MPQKSFLILVIGAIFLSGCNFPTRDVGEPPAVEDLYAQIKSTLEADAPLSSKTISPEFTQQSLEQPTDSVGNLGNDASILFLHDGLPEKFLASVDLSQFSQTMDEKEANTLILIGPKDNSDNASIKSKWIYVLTAPFFTLTDDISSESLQMFWNGDNTAINGFSKIYVSGSTNAAISEIFGAANDKTVKVFLDDSLDEIIVKESDTLFILPFEGLNNRLKVMSIDGKSPIDDQFNPDNYPFTLRVWVETNLDKHSINLPESNYDPGLRTVLVMTGVTAMTRATAHQMETRGNQFPGQDIQRWLVSADLTHISNEVPFASDCPTPNPVQSDLIFCSSPERITLLEFVGADIIELSGNHLLDYGLPAVNLTLEMYEERGWYTYAGGWDLEDSRSPARISHNGNKLAFIGCNTVGPPNAWATETKPGAAPCGDFSWMISEIGKQKEEGYLPIVTLQYAEDYTAYPSAQMKAHFQMLAEAGAIVVNGSQAHTSKMMAFENGSFLHYGLGNLFFDQMEVYYNDVYLSGTREEFIDRLIFYDGELISIQLLTAMLEDYARPRPMTADERESFLNRIFSTAIENR